MRSAISPGLASHGEAVEPNRKGTDGVAHHLGVGRGADRTSPAGGVADDRSDVGSVGTARRQETRVVGDEVATDEVTPGQVPSGASEDARPRPVLPAYDGACTANVVDVLVEDPDRPHNAG